MGQVRPDRQTLLFTATMPNKVNNLVSDCLTTPVRVTVGEIGAANQDIQQASFLCCLYHSLSAAARKTLLSDCLAANITA